MTVSSPERVTGQFNAHLGGLVLLGIEEGFWAGDKRAESVLKDLITSSSITVEQKFADTYVVHNHVRLLVTSNEDWIVPAGIGDRRWAVFNVKPDRANDLTYWGPIWEALDADGPAHLLHFLLSVEYDKALLHRPPMTAAKVDQTVHSLDPVDHWWLDVLRGDQLSADNVFGQEVQKDTLYDDHAHWCLCHKRRSIDASFFWKRLRKLTADPLREKRRRKGADRSRAVSVPPLECCREAFAQVIGCEWATLAGSE